MGLFKRIAGFLGLGTHEVNKDSEEENDHNSTEESHPHYDPTRPRKGFSVPVQVPVDKPHHIGPILVPCPGGDGGVQGLQWYTRSLKMDEHGDVADEFFEEVVLPEAVVANAPQRTRLEFKVNLSTRSVKARDPFLSREGTVQHYVKHHGRLQLLG